MTGAEQDQARAIIEQRDADLAAAETKYNHTLIDLSEQMREAGREYDLALKRIHAAFRKARDGIKSMSVSQ